MAAVEALGAVSGWPRAAASRDTDLVDLMERLSAAQRKDVSRLPALALRAFGIVYAITKAFRGETFSEGTFNPIDARPDRLPMGVMVKRIEAIKDKPLTFLWRDVIERWIIAQHVHWSAVRGTDGKKRLRIGLEGPGWIRVRPKASAVFNATPDRLATRAGLAGDRERRHSRNAQAARRARDSDTEAGNGQCLASRDAAQCRKRCRHDDVGQRRGEFEQRHVGSRAACGITGEIETRMARDCRSS
jgi:hypothetical protein